MHNLAFTVQSAAPVEFAAVPMLELRLRIVQRGEPLSKIEAIALHCQIRVEPARRTYTDCPPDRLHDLFGPRERWSQTMRSMLWTHADVMVSSFSDEITASLPIPCSYDFNVAATKYFAALDGGEIPLELLFSGTVFYRSADEQLQIAQLAWNNETRYRLPVGIWRTMMDLYYPNCAWLCVQQEVFNSLADYKSRQGLATWEQAIESLLAAQRNEVSI